MSRLAVILYAEAHHPRGSYATMFRCVARLRTQQPHIAWYAAFGNEPPQLAYVVRNAQRYSTMRPLLIPWTLRMPHAGAPYVDASTIITSPIGMHPLIHDIVVQRANEAHYLRNPTGYHAHNAQTIYVGDEHTAVMHTPHRCLADIVAQADTYIGDVIVQPIALSQNDEIVHAIAQQTARGMPLERFGVGRAIEYDRRLLTIINDIVRPYC